jgi:hypothetical protein
MVEPNNFDPMVCSKTLITYYLLREMAILSTHRPYPDLSRSFCLRSSPHMGGFVAPDRIVHEVSHLTRKELDINTIGGVAIP